MCFIGACIIFKSSKLLIFIQINGRNKSFIQIAFSRQRFKAFKITAALETHFAVVCRYSSVLFNHLTAQKASPFTAGSRMLFPVYRMYGIVVETDCKTRFFLSVHNDLFL